MKKKHEKKVHHGTKSHSEKKEHHKKAHHKKEAHHKEKKSKAKHKDGHSKNFIAGAIKHPGALRKELHVKKGHKIPAEKLKKAAHHKGVEGRRARLAITLKKLGHRKHKKGE